MTDYIMTLDSDSEDGALAGTTNDDGQGAENAGLNPNFIFDISGDSYMDMTENYANPVDLVMKGAKPEPLSVNEIITRRGLTHKRKYHDEDDDEYEEIFDENILNSDEYQPGDSGRIFNGNTKDASATSNHEQDMDLKDGEDSEYSYSSPSDSNSQPETRAEKDRKAAYFDSEIIPDQVHESFLTMNLSRPILKALTTLRFHKPTPIQAATIPIALLGKDVVGGAVTGSGKTAAFIIPTLERLLYREKGKHAAATRCLVLVPTRELAVQCFDVGSKLATHTDIRFCLVVGGLSIKSQEMTLRTRPDVIIATPGRLIDHIRNSPSFTLDTLDVLILDEADRMLSDGFADELAEIIKSCPIARQTMLFSATMTDSIDELVKMSLNKPVRLFVDPRRSMARGLIQEFVRVRAGKEAERSALLIALCKRTFKTNVIIFLRSKRLAHQMRIVFNLLNMRCEELHGDLSQEQRLKSLQLFRDGAVDFLMATDLASRGLDIKGVETVINYDMPGQLAQYLHRVGRTARAGKNGRSITIVGEADRKMLKAAIKHSVREDQIRHRIVATEIISKWVARLAELKDEVSAVLRDEKEERHFRQAEMELKKGQNMIEHEDEIYSRPARTWFQTGKAKERSEALSKQQYEAGFGGSDKLLHNKSGENEVMADPSPSLEQLLTRQSNKPKRDKFAGLSRKAKRRKMTMDEDEELGDERALKAAIRSAKKSARPSKIGAPEKLPSITKRKPMRVVSHTGGAFERDMDKKTGHREGIRAKKGDVIGRLGKKNGSWRKAR